MKLRFGLALLTSLLLAGSMPEARGQDPDEVRVLELPPLVIRAKRPAGHLGKEVLSSEMKTALLKLYRENEKNAGWLKANGLFQKAELLKALATAARTQRQAINDEIDRRFDMIMLDDEGSERMFCGLNDAGFAQWQKEYDATARLGASLEERYPLGQEIFARSERDKFQREEIGRIENRAKLRLAEISMKRTQCRYADKQLPGVKRTETSLTELRQVLTKKIDALTLTRTFDNAKTAPGEVPPPIMADNPYKGKRPPPTSGPGALKRVSAGTKKPEVEADQVESFETLTEGIIFDGPDEVPYNVFGFEFGSHKNPKKAAFEKALKHLYSIPTGREVLRDVQKMRKRRGEQFAQGIAELEAKIKKSKERLAAENKNLAALWKEADALDPDDPKNIDHLTALKKVIAAAEARKKSLEDQEGLKWVLRAKKEGPTPDVVVQIIKTDVLTGGWANTSQFQVWRHEPKTEGGKDRVAYAMVLAISEKVMQDGNPSRAIDKTLAHELRHVADNAHFQMAEKRGLTMLLTEGRAYLTDAKAVMEQQKDMRKEPRSQAVAWRRDYEVADILEDPTEFRTEYLSSPLYIWHVTPSDLTGERAVDDSLRWRLSQAYDKLLYSSDERYKETVSRLHRYGTGIEKAFKDSESIDDEFDFYKKKAWFIDEAFKSAGAQGWRSRVLTLMRDLRKDTPEARAFNAEYRVLEKAHWKDLNNFYLQYAGTRPKR